MKACEIIAIIEKTAPLPFAAPWDNSGVQVAAFRTEVNTLAVLLDPTLESLSRAVENGAEFILAHHPLSMQPRYPDRADAYLSILSLLLRRDIWLYSAHTSLDANPAGPVRWLADALELRDIAILESAQGAVQSGFGFTGRLADPVPYHDFCNLLSNALGKRSWQSCGPRPQTVSRLACCPGSGGSLLAVAADSGADIFITGDIKYHSALEAEAVGLHVLDVGHFILEEEMMRRFAVTLADTLPLPVAFVPGVDPLRREPM